MNRTITIKDMSIKDTNFFKGLAILMIVFHNYFHWLPPGIGENEQDFNVERVERFLAVLFQTPEYTLQAIFSFLGHYGVQVFIFLSAYGLTKKYIDQGHVGDYFTYLKRRIWKIYPPFLFSILIWLVYYGFWHSDPITLFMETWKSLAVKLALVANFFPGQFYALNGPWWFVSLIVQFYLIFPWLLKLYLDHGAKALVMVSLSGLVLTALLQPYVGIPLPGTMLTHLPEVCLGIYFAAQKEVSIRIEVMLATLLIFVLSNFSLTLWYFSFASVTLLLLFSFQKLQASMSDRWVRAVLFVGGISMYVFYINGFMRHPWVEWAKTNQSWIINIVLGFVFVVAVLLFSVIMDKTMKNFFSKKKVL